MSESVDEFTDDLDIILDDYEEGEISREALIEQVTEDVVELLTFEAGDRFER